MGSGLGRESKPVLPEFVSDRPGRGRPALRQNERRRRARAAARLGFGPYHALPSRARPRESRLA